MPKISTPLQSSVDDWERLPKPRGRLCALSRTTLLELGELGEITIAAIRKPGSQKAIRLVYMPSLHAYLRTCIENPQPKPLKSQQVTSPKPLKVNQ